MAVSSGVGRSPLWSGVVTGPVARWIPPTTRPAVLVILKGVHTALFVSIAACILLYLADGIGRRPGRRGTVALGIALAESAIYASNNQVCPLTPLAEQLGAERGSVADIFLPEWLSRRIPVLGGSALVLGLALHVRAWLRT